MRFSSVFLGDILLMVKKLLEKDLELEIGVHGWWGWVLVEVKDTVTWDSIRRRRWQRPVGTVGSLWDHQVGRGEEGSREQRSGGTAGEWSLTESRRT